MPQIDPALNQWQLRHRAALAAVKTAEAQRDPQAVRKAYEQLRQVTMAKPDGQAKPQGQMGMQPSGPMRPKPAGAPRQKRGILSTIADTLNAANRP